VYKKLDEVYVEKTIVFLNMCILNFLQFLSWNSSDTPCTH